MKVLFFDTWTLGIGNFVPIARELKNKNVDCLLIHRGSMGAEPGRPKEEVIQGIKTRDITFYSSALIHKIFNKEKPDAIVILSSFYILDRAVILSARALGIKTFFLMPGIREVDEEYIRTTEYETKFRKLNSIKSKLKKIPKYLTFVIPNYFYSGIKNSKYFLLRLSPWKTLVELFLQPGRKILYPTPSSEIHCDKALVYARRYKKFFHEKYGYPLEQIEIVGNPSLDIAHHLIGDFESKAHFDKQFREEKKIEPNKPIVTYLTTPFVEAGYEGWTPKVRVEQIKEFLDGCAEAGFPLVVKLHPAIKDPAIYELEKTFNGITIVYTCDLPNLVNISSAIIGHHSSTLLIPIAFEKPLFIPRWGLMSKLNDRFSGEGVAVAVKSLEQLIFSLKQIKLEKFSNILGPEKKTFFGNYITIFDGKAVERCGDIIHSQINNKA